MLTFSHIKDLYALLAIRELTKEHPFNGAWEKLDEDAAEMLDSLVPALSYGLRDYLVLACFGEARHAISTAGRWSYPDLPLFSRSNGEISMPRTDLMYDALNYNPELALSVLVGLFDADNWYGNGMGGERWVQIAKAALTWWGVFKNRPIAFIDHVVDLRHNNGTAFSKSEADTVTNTAMTEFLDPFTLERWLNFKRDASPLYLVERVRPVLFKTRRMVQRCCMLSDILRLEDYQDYSDSTDVDYKDYTPLVWGNDVLTLKEKRQPRNYMVTSQFFTRGMKWKTIKEIWADPGDLMEREELVAYLKKYEQTVKKAVDKKFQPFKAKYPQHADSIDIESTWRVKQITLRALRAKYEPLMNKWQEISREFADKDWSTFEEFQNNQKEFMANLEAEIHEMINQSPYSIQDALRLRGQNEIYEAKKLSTEWLSRRFGLNDIAVVDVYMKQINTIYIEAIKWMTRLDGGLENEVVVKRAKAEAVRLTFAELLPTAFQKILIEKLDIYISNMKPSQKEVMPIAVAFEAAFLNEPPNSPTHAEWASKAVKDANSNVVSDAAISPLNYLNKLYDKLGNKKETP